MTRWMLVTCSLIGCGADSVFGQKPLPKRQQAQLAGIVDAVRNAGPVDVVNAAAPVIGSVSDSLLAAMNEALAGEALPSVGELLVPVQELLRVFGSWADGVVPLGADVVAGELDRFEFGFRDFQASLVCFVEAGRGDFQAGPGRGAANKPQ